MLRLPRSSTLFPYTSLFRSDDAFVWIAWEVARIGIDHEPRRIHFPPDAEQHVGIRGETPMVLERHDNARLFGLWQTCRSEGTRLNSSHSQISYAVFCLKKQN